MQTLLFVWLALSGWLFRIFLFSTFVLPFAAPLLLGTFANRVAIEVNGHLSFKVCCPQLIPITPKGICSTLCVTGCSCSCFI